MDTPQEPVYTEQAPQYAKLAPGEYEAQCFGAKVERIWLYGGTWKLRLTFRILAGVGADDSKPVELVKFYNLGRGKKPHVTRKSQYWLAWVLANHGELPRRGQTMSSRIFIGKVFRVKVAEVKYRFNGSPHPADATYSTITKLLEVKVG